MGELEGKRIGLIGGGAMAEALAGGLVAAGVAPDHVTAADPDPARREHLAQHLALRTTADNDEVVALSDVVVLAVKPAKVGDVLKALGKDTEPERPLWISIAAGVTLAQIEAHLPAATRVVRAMPNTPAQVAAGATALAANAAADAGDRAVAEALFGAVGITWQAPSEDLLDAVTGLSGSGPAYVFLFLEALGDAGVAAGLPREAAERLAAQTLFGAAKLVLETGLRPAVLREQVTSPGGTTVAGLESLEASDLRGTLEKAVGAATRRSRELRGEN